MTPASAIHALVETELFFLETPQSAERYEHLLGVAKTYIDRAYSLAFYTTSEQKYVYSDDLRNSFKAKHRLLRGINQGLLNKSKQSKL